MSARSYLSGNRPYRLEYIRETAAGTTPVNATWYRFSDRARMFDPTIDPQGEGQRGLGDPDPDAHRVGTESSQITVEYDLQQKNASANTFEDNSGNPNDAVTDALDRDSDNRLPNRHTVVRRVEQSDLEASNTVSGNTSRDARFYVVGKGGTPTDPVLTIDPSNPNPVTVELPYEFEKVRVYKIDQPTSSEGSEEVWVESTDNGDTSQTVTIEDEGASTTEDISLNGTTQVQGSNTFSDIDSISLSGETAGDVNVYVDNSNSAGDLLATIRGQNSYDHGEGDLGVPALGASGTRDGSIGQNYEAVPTVTVERPDGTALADQVGTSSISVTNDVEATEQGGTPRPDLAVGDRTSMVEATVWGENESYQYVDEMLRTTATNINTTFTGGTLRVDNAVAMSTDWSEEASQAKAEIDVSFEGEGVAFFA